MILDELLQYVQLDDADRARLAALHDRLLPELPALADAFYVAVYANPGAARVLRDDAQVERLRRMLVDWMETGLRGPYDAAFERPRARIGRRHVEIGLAQHYMFTAINVLRRGYAERIGRWYPADEAIRMVIAVDKLFDIELALMLRHYQLVSEEQRTTSLQRMTANLAHEVRNPLNAAKLQLELAERRARRNDLRVAEPIETAHVEIRRLTGLLNEFLAFAQPAPLALGDHDAVAIARHAITGELEGSVAFAPDGPIYARIDADKVEQIIANVVRNAVEAAGRAELAIERVGNELVIRVRDTGPGMPPEVRARIYEPFFTTKAAGTGMGLAIVHAFVSMHGGSLAIDSTSAGTRVEVSLPARGP